jgi:hypothetical protein
MMRTVNFIVGVGRIVCKRLKFVWIGCVDGSGPGLNMEGIERAGFG